MKQRLKKELALVSNCVERSTFPTTCRYKVIYERSKDPSYDAANAARSLLALAPFI